jgi:dTDP-4-amino-4,6-dideoxygalactose transaminase
MNVPFLDLVAQQRPLRDEILSDWAEIYDTARFVSGAKVAAFERSFADAHEVDHAVAVSTGTAALELALRALDIGPDDRVILPANTFIATAEAVSNVGAVPVLVDCDPTTRNISAEAAIAAMDAIDVHAVIPVHLYGQPADLDPILDAARRRGIAVVEDAAQAHLARYKGRSVGGLGDIAAFSFYPGKNLGAPGEGGAVTTSDPDLADRVRMLRDHGQVRKYLSTVVGTNARMHEIVAAALSVKLRFLDEWTEARRAVASRYLEELAGIPGVTLFPELEWARSVYHLFVVEVEARPEVMASLEAQGIGFGLHYPVPIHLQAAYEDLGLGLGSFPNAEASAERLLSLPMFPEMTQDQITAVITAVRTAAQQAAVAVENQEPM